MRLSDLVRMAKEAGLDDPEVEVYEEDLPHWETFRPEAPVFRGGKLFLAGDTSARTACWEDGRAANPFAPENRRPAAKPARVSPEALAAADRGELLRLCGERDMLVLSLDSDDGIREALEGWNLYHGGAR